MKLPAIEENQKYGRLTVIQFSHVNDRRCKCYLCRCDCGTEKIVRGYALKNGSTLSCGCLTRENSSVTSIARAKIQLVPGIRFGRWTVVEFSHTNKYNSRCFVCLCDCGTSRVVNRNDLVSGKSASCGCLNRERVSETHSGENHFNYVDGRCGTKLHRLWQGMNERCNDPKHISYKYYGGKGVKVCDEWMNDFAAFKFWAESCGYKPGLSIERKKTDEGYCPENCEWITRSENTARCNRTRHTKKENK